MKWTRIIPFAALAVAAPAVVAAQDTIKPTPPPTQQNPSTPMYQHTPQQQQDSTNWYHQRTSALLKGITLTAEQKTKVDSIQLKFKDQLPPMPNQTQRQNDPNNPPTTQQPDSAQQSLLLMVLERQDTEVRAALKPDQQKIWDKNKQEWKKNRTPIG